MALVPVVLVVVLEPLAVLPEETPLPLPLPLEGTEEPTLAEGALEEPDSPL